MLVAWNNNQGFRYVTNINFIFLELPRFMMAVNVVMNTWNQSEAKQKFQSFNCLGAKNHMWCRKAKKVQVNNHNFKFDVVCYSCSWFLASLAEVPHVLFPSNNISIERNYFDSWAASDSIGSEVYIRPGETQGASPVNKPINLIPWYSLVLHWSSIL